MNIEALRLARAKAMAAKWEGSWSDISEHQQAYFIDLAGIVEAADAALGVVSVPREATQDMARAYIDAMPIAPGTETWTMARIPASAEIWSAMLAASPLREKSDE